MIKGLAAYADAYAQEDWGTLAEDHVIGDAWLDMLKGCRALLNGDRERFDGGVLDHMLLGMLEVAGFEESDL